MISMAIPKGMIDEFLNNTQNTILCKQLPYTLRKYTGTSNFEFIFDSDNKVCLCSNNRLMAEATISKLYNLHFVEKNSVGLQIFKSRNACVEELYKDWCNISHKDTETEWINDAEFYDYLVKIGFFHANYAIKLTNIRKIS